MERKFKSDLYLRSARKEKRNFFPTILLIFIIIIVGYSVFIFFTKNSNTNSLVDPSVLSNPNLKQNGSRETLIKKNPLGDAVEGALVGTRGDYAVVIKNLKTNESYMKNESKLYESGSLYKLWVMATAFKQIQDGTLTKEEVLSDSIVNLNQEFGLSPQEAEMKTGTITITVGNALRQMITISHNYAAMLLTDKVKVSSIENFLQSNGFKYSTLGSGTDVPQSNANEISLFFEKLYKGELANQVYTTEMIDILKAQQFDGGLPKYLPENTLVANKTGDIGWFKHDAGIIFTDIGDYIIVVMSETQSPAGAQDRIALISKAVYEYFTKEP